jgi:ferrochelatase
MSSAPPPALPPRTGIVLSNMGSPQAPTARSVRKYLAQFLWDPDVVRAPRLLWWILLHGYILRTRPYSSARAYRKIWTAVGSPLLAISGRQAEALEAKLQGEGLHAHVRAGMRYGRPSIREAVHTLIRRKRCDRLVLFPLYPQFSRTTTGSSLRAWEWHKARRPQYEYLAVEPYFRHPAYIRALALCVKDAWSKGGQAERLLLSFHGLPATSIAEGDPYHTQCLETARLLAVELELEEGDWGVAFQSRFGRKEWLTPYTSETLQKWGREGVRDVDVLCPGFSADGLETLYEVKQELRKVFLHYGGGAFRYIPALNDHPFHIEALAEIVRPLVLK